MDVLDRINAPKSSSLETIKLIEGSSHVLKNGMPVYYINTPDCNVLRVDFVFNAGLRNQKMPGQATATGSMLSEGTSKYSAKELADALDNYGAYFQSKVHVDDAQITLYCLPKFLPQSLEYVYAVLTDCTFPERELETYKTNSIQRLLVNSQRNSFLNRRAFYSSIFGNTNSYGSPVNKGDYENISRGTASSFYQENYLPGIKYVLVSGQADGPILSLLDGALSSLPFLPAAPSPIHLSESRAENLFVENDNSVQSAIRIGRKLFGRNHPDFKKMQVLNLALGGYFGSRLMKNIREEKGLTYGIYSAVESYWDGGAFYVETEINNELRETGRTEILHEIGKLREELLPDQELNLVKNYLLGSFLRSIDGPFALADRYKMLLDYGFTYEYYQDFVDTIKQVSASELRSLANTYLQESDLSTVIVGKK
jgi:predicted Zn-dependent peptidase